jgi:WD40 repeat protein
LAQPDSPSKYASIEAGQKEESVSVIRFSPAGDVLAYILNGKVVGTWDAKTKKGKTLQKAAVLFADISWSPDGKKLAVVGVSRIHEIDVLTGELRELYRHKDEASCVRYSHDGKWIVSGGSDDVIRVWDVDKKAEAKQIECNGIALDLAPIPGSDQVLAAVSQLVPKPNEPNVGVISHNVLRADLKTTKVKPVIENAAALRESLAVSPDGKWLAVVDGRKVVIKEAATLKDEGALECPLKPVTCRLSKSGRLLVVGGSRKDAPTILGPVPGEVAVYDRESKKWVSHFRVLDDQVNHIALSPSEDLLAVSSTKLGTITVWDLSPLTGKADGKKDKGPGK